MAGIQHPSIPPCNTSLPAPPQPRNFQGTDEAPLWRVHILPWVRETPPQGTEAYPTEIRIGSLEHTKSFPHNKTLCPCHPTPCSTEAPAWNTQAPHWSTRACPHNTPTAEWRTHGSLQGSKKTTRGTQASHWRWEAPPLAPKSFCGMHKHLSGILPGDGSIFLLDPCISY